jgi:hypothetical protein
MKDLRCRTNANQHGSLSSLTRRAAPALTATDAIGTFSLTVSIWHGWCPGTDSSRAVDQLSVGAPTLPLPPHFVHRGPKILFPGAGFLITGTKPVPLQAGHISSATSDFIGFTRHAAPAQSTRAIDYTFLKLRNQLRRVSE